MKKYFCLYECNSWKCENWKHGMRSGAAIGFGVMIPIGWVIIMFVLCKKSITVAAHDAVKNEMGKP